MKIVKLNYLFGIFLCGLAFICQSAENDDLYSGKIPVESQQVSVREAAMQQALVQVLVKLSGNSHITPLPTSEQASQWAQQYRYDQDALIVQFDPKAVNNYLKKNNIPIWEGERPLTLVWMAVEENGTQAIVGEYELALAHWQQWFSTESRAHAIPVLFPLLDLTDKQQVELNDVWYHVSSALQPAAARYQATNTLSGRVYQNLQTQNWSADWLLALPTEQVSWQEEAPTPEALMRASVDRFANEVATRAEKTDASTQPSKIVLNIDNVKNAHSYLRVMSYLQSLNVLDTIAPIKITPTTVTLQLKLKGHLALLEQQLAMGQMLQPLPSTDEHTLHYQYL